MLMKFTETKNTNFTSLKKKYAKVIIKFIYCNWVVTRWQWLFYTYTKHEIGCC